MENKRQKIEIADIFRSFKSDYYQQYSLSQEQKKTFNAVINCRSQKLGGYTLKCNNCGHIEHAYNSCRNRHCPKCQYLKQIIWVDKLKARLLPVKYFHIVYAKPALNCTAKVIEYLGRYTHRVAISNSRIVNIINDSVLFRWKDYRKGGKTKIMKLKAVEFINRFLMHVLPCGFYKIRYYGIFANKLSGNLLDTYLVLNGQEMDTSALEGKCWQEIVQDTLGYNPFHCSICKKGIMIWQNNIIPQPRAA